MSIIIRNFLNKGHNKSLIIKKQIVNILLLIIIFLIPIFFRNDFYAGILFQVLLWAGLSGAWNLLGGYGGQFSLCHITFFGIGAYTSTLLEINFSISPWFGILIGASLSSIIGMFLGAICFKLKGHFFTLATLAFGQIVYIIALSWKSLTNGSEGLLIMEKQGFSHMIFSSKLPYVYLALIFMLLVYIISLYMEHSVLGYSLMAYRENDEAARSIGINTFKARVITSGISAFLMAVGGTIYAQYMYYIDPDSVFVIFLSVQVALIAIIGGLGQSLGPILGSFLIIPLSQLLRGWLGSSISGLYLIIYGIILIVVLLNIPKGILSKVKLLQIKK